MSLEEAQLNHRNTWLDMFKAAETEYEGEEFETIFGEMVQNTQTTLDRNKPIDYRILVDPNHPITRACLFYYTSETFLYGVLNASSRNGDTTKVSTLGPYAQILRAIVSLAGQSRTDIDVSKFAKTTLYRGAALTKAEVKDYRNHIGKRHLKDGPWESRIKKGDPVRMSLFGYTSTSLNRDAAEGFAWSNNISGKMKTLFVIEWDCRMAYYYMNMGQYNDEQEVLLNDGFSFIVKEVEETEQEGEPFYIITLSTK